MASTPSTTTSPPTASKPQRILACVLCQHRKIKCDRTFPCSNCTKANVKCTPSTPAPARKRRRPNQDLQERLARCEELLKEYATTDKPEPTTPTQSFKVPTYDDPYLKWQPTGKLVKEDGGVRFMDSFLLGTVYDELRAMRDIVDADDYEDCTPETMTPDDNSDLLLGGESPAQNPEDLWPEPSQVFRLWQVYLDKVNPLTKIIHVPTLQPFLATATTGSHNVPKNIEALLFSIFLMAVVASSEDECTLVLGYSKSQAIQRFSSGVRLSLMRMGFLKTHDLTTLQALVIYLISLQGRYNRHAAWILNGVVIRIAQKMGLHRDGDVLGLGPFESEMRRRLWWQIIMLDAKYAMLSGLSHSLLPRSWDTKSPQNLNDADIYPSATEPFQDRNGPTEMIFCLICYRVAKFLTQSPGFETLILCGELEAMQHGPDGEPGVEQMKGFRSTIENLGLDLLSILERYCDPSAGPVHQMAIQMKDHILDKLRELITPPREQPEWGSEVRSPKDNAFKVAVGTLEHNYQNYTSSMNKGFLWWSLLHFQTDVFIYMVGQLCSRTDGNLVERAWKQVGGVYRFHPELFDVSNKQYFTLSLFVVKAWRRRKEILIAKGEIPETPFYIEQLQEVMPHDDKSELTPTDSSVSLSSEKMDTSSDVLKGGNTPDPAFDQLLGGYLDPASLEWGDMFNMPLQVPMNTGVNQQAAQFPNFAYGIGPTAEW